MILRSCFRSIVLVGLAASAVVAARALPAQAAAMAAPLDSVAAAAIVASARAEIDAANAAWIPGMRQRDAAMITAAYADSGLFIAANGTVTRGRAAITAMYASTFPRLREIRDGAVVTDGLTVAGPTLIYEWGHAWVEMAAAMPGAPAVRGGGSYLTVWQRQSDGHWRIVRNLSF